MCVCVQQKDRQAGRRVTQAFCLCTKGRKESDKQPSNGAEKDRQMERVTIDGALDWKWRRLSTSPCITLVYMKSQNTSHAVLSLLLHSSLFPFAMFVPSTSSSSDNLPLEPPVSLINFCVNNFLCVSPGPCGQENTRRQEKGLGCRV